MISSKRTFSLRILLLIVSALCAVSACAPNPTPEISKPAPVTEADEIEMGQEIDRSLMASRRFYNDSALERYVYELGMRLVAGSGRTKLPWTFRVLDDPGTNAFAFPGGFVYITRGMLAFLNSEAQLAAVLGHEIGHVAAGHAVERGKRLGITGQGLVVGTVGGTMTPVYGSIDRLQALLLAHSRQSEQQADSLGLYFMSAAGYEPREMLVVLHSLQFTVGGPAWLASHPSPENRVANLTHAWSALQTPGTLVERRGYLAHVDGLVFGVDRRQGYLAGRRLVVPDRGFQFTFPEGWTLSRDGPAVRAVSPGQDATVELTTTGQTTLDSAARHFFSKVGKARTPPMRDNVNGNPVVTATFSALPLEIKMGGSVRLIELRGRVYRVIGYCRDDLWPAYRDLVDTTLLTFEAVPDAELRRAEPLHVTLVSLKEPKSVVALRIARPSPLGPAELAGLNQVGADSVLPAGQVVKWVVGPPTQ